MALSAEEITAHYTSTLHALGEIAWSYYYQGQLDDAMKLFEQGSHLLGFPEIAVIDRARFLLRYAEFVIANYFLTNQDEELMLTIIHQAQETARHSQDQQSQATVLYLTGQMRYYQNIQKGIQDYTEARTTLQQAHKLYATLGATEGIAQILFYIGLTHEREDDEERAEAYYQQALEIARRHSYKWIISEATRHLSGLAMQKDTDLALRYALESLRLRSEIGFKRALPAAHFLVSDVYTRRNELNKALEHCQQGRQLAEEMGLRSAILMSLLTLGQIQQQQAAFEEAQSTFEAAAQLAQELHIAFAISAARESLARLASQRAQRKMDADKHN
ncbi:tetratricopeptide repeat protein [Dictyobacter formicarum]|uniref:MalT-like TPR region domain-containing protein n=1 Tax=Dictyobacter formicarum TaxID=2778368 RepID=A0ABQ3VDX6_9CHLR|nr:tetratricopeptide repeat protein [Dictyobacter formicarum]GHO83916.1 hypothetical protein KSZ_19220 [Dictyobacter formicarum]